jgi:hypothetical protein
MENDPTSWLLLLHQLPNSPAFLRVKMWRRLQKIGAVPVKNGVYVLPNSEQSLEDLHWVAREIMESGGDASVCEATFVEGVTNRDVIQLFHAAREADYAQALEEARGLADELKAASVDPGAETASIASRLAKLRQRLTDIQSIDFFSAPARKPVDSLLAQLETKLRKVPIRKAQTQGDYSGRTWVTRRGIHVDRIASAWLIRRLIDPAAKFKFVAAKGYRPESGEIRFDMFDAEFTHEGGRCTFEVLIDRLDISDRALKPIAEIIHDIDLKDSKFERPETPGIALLVAAICTANKEDLDRLERGSAVLDDLYEFYKKR